MVVVVAAAVEFVAAAVQPSAVGEQQPAAEN